MRDVKKPLRGAYILALAGISVPVYDKFVPSTNISDTYVVITNQTDLEVNFNKCGSEHQPTVVLDIVHRTTEQGGSRYCDDVADEILQIVPEGTLSIPGFEVKDSRVVGDDDLSEYTSTLKVYRRILRFQHTVKEI